MTHSSKAQSLRTVAEWSEATRNAASASDREGTLLFASGADGNDDDTFVEEEALSSSMVDALEDILQYERASERSMKVAAVAVAIAPDDAKATGSR